MITDTTIILIENRVRSPLYPTSAQTLICFILCQNITNMLLPIFIVRLDERDGSIFILAGQETGIVITRDGQWSFTPWNLISRLWALKS